MKNTPHIESFLKHIFQDQYEKGLDYLDLLLFEKGQKLPTLIFPQTNYFSGKSTFIRLLELMHNCGTITLESGELLSRYNHKWAKRRIIAIEGISGKRLEILEKVKLLQTCHEIVVDSKHEDVVYPSKFCGCFVITGVDTHKLEIGERNWVISPEKIENPDYYLIDQMEPEISEFKRFLLHRHRHFRKVGRLYFA